MALTRDDVDLLDRTTVYHGYFRIDRFRLRHRLQSGAWSRPLIRECFERGHAAAVLPYDPVSDNVVLIEQFRIGALSAGLAPWVLEVVAGVMEEGETPEEVARREAEEETGFPVGELVKICDYLSSPGGASELVRLFCGRCNSADAAGVHGMAEEDEDILVLPMPFADALDLLERGGVNNAVTIIALQWLALHRDGLRRRWLAE